MLIIFCIFKTERTGFLIESIMCLGTVSAACIFKSDNCHVSNRACRDDVIQVSLLIRWRYITRCLSLCLTKFGAQNME